MVVHNIAVFSRLCQFFKREGLECAGDQNLFSESADRLTSKFICKSSSASSICICMDSHSRGFVAYLYQFKAYLYQFKAEEVETIPNCLLIVFRIDWLLSAIPTSMSHHCDLMLSASWTIKSVFSASRASRNEDNKFLKLSSPRFQIMKWLLDDSMSQSMKHIIINLFK